MMKGKVVVITGSNAGIGMETAVGLASMGATTVLAPAAIRRRRR
jgi:NAD(P)-dependent dehydrogenase (short-subunit alcohol dehydrogenase family)